MQYQKVLATAAVRCTLAWTETQNRILDLEESDRCDDLVSLRIEPAQLTAPLCKSGQKEGFTMESRMAVAMRVINLMSAHQAAAPEDVALLRAWAAHEDRNRTPDELAYRIIEVDLLRRKNAMASGDAPSS